MLHLIYDYCLGWCEVNAYPSIMKYRRVGQTFQSHKTCYKKVPHESFTALSSVAQVIALLLGEFWLKIFLEDPKKKRMSGYMCGGARNSCFCQG